MTQAVPPLKVGMIGVGTHARQVLIPAIEQIPDTMRLVALATAHEETAAAARERYQTTFSIPYGENQQLYLRGYVPELSEFAHCVRTGAPPTCGVDDALATLRVGEAVRQSRDSGSRWVTVRGDRTSHP